MRNVWILSLSILMGCQGYVTQDGPAGLLPTSRVEPLPKGLEKDEESNGGSEGSEGSKEKRETTPPTNPSQSGLQGSCQGQVLQTGRGAKHSYKEFVEVMPGTSKDLCIPFQAPDNIEILGLEVFWANQPDFECHSVGAVLSQTFTPTGRTQPSSNDAGIGSSGHAWLHGNSGRWAGNQPTPWNVERGWYKLTLRGTPRENAEHWLVRNPDCYEYRLTVKWVGERSDGVACRNGFEPNTVDCDD